MRSRRLQGVVRLVGAVAVKAIGREVDEGRCGVSRHSELAVEETGLLLVEVSTISFFQVGKGRENPHYWQQQGC